MLFKYEDIKQIKLVQIAALQSITFMENNN